MWVVYLPVFYEEKLDQTAGVISSCKYKKIKHNGKKTKDKMTNNDL